jgi:hypothetical protein
MGQSPPRWIAATAALTLLVTACSSSPRSTSPTSTTTVPAVATSQPVGPDVVVDGIGHGWRQDDEGAHAAAVNALSVTGEIATAGFITRDDLVESIASTDYAPELAAMSSRQLDELSLELGEAGIAPNQLVWSEIPLRARVVTADRDHSVVDVWSVLVVGIPGHGAPRQVWRTVTVELIWERDDWRIDGWDTVAGPTPALAAASEVSMVEDLATVLAWPAPGGS